MIIGIAASPTPNHSLNRTVAGGASPVGRGPVSLAVRPPRMHNAARLLLGITLVSALLGCASRPDHFHHRIGGQALARHEAERAIVQKDLDAQVNSQLDAPLKLLQVKLPAYPKARKRVKGAPDILVSVEFSVAATGLVSDAVVVGPTDPDFAKLCQTAVRTWQFGPLSKGESRCGTPLSVPV